MNLRTKITLGATAAIGVALLVALFLNMNMFGDFIRRSSERQLLNTANVVAEFPEVVQGLRDSPFKGLVQNRVQKIIDVTRGVDQITVCNMQRIRYSHANPEFIGLVQEGDDFKEVLYQAKRYVGVYNHGDDGSYMRAYAPVFDGGEQIGFVIAGAFGDRVRDSARQLSFSAVVFSLAGLSFGVIGAILLAHRASKNLLGLEPEEIAQVYREHAGLIEAMHEGVVAINRRGRITFINSSARKLLNLGDRQVDGAEIDSVMPNPRLPAVIATGEAEFEYEKRINNRTFIANMVPVLDGEQVIGAVETFQDRTQLIRMAEELTGIKQLVEALRASSHEFSNKLHVVLGLLELGDVDKAKQYVQTTQTAHGKLHTQMLRAFREPMISGLMLGKVGAAREQGVRLEVASGSGLESSLSESLAHSLVLVLGNLVDNAIDSTRGNAERDGRVGVDIRQKNGEILLEVEDNGPGIPQADVENIFRKGFSTKGDGRGTGLHLVRQELELLGGSIRVDSSPGKTVFDVILPDGTRL